MALRAIPRNLSAPIVGRADIPPKRRIKAGKSGKKKRKTEQGTRFLILGKTSHLKSVQPSKKMLRLDLSSLKVASGQHSKLTLLEKPPTPKRQAEPVRQSGLLSQHPSAPKLSKKWSIKSKYASHKLRRRWGEGHKILQTFVITINGVRHCSITKSFRSSGCLNVGLL